VIIISDTGDLFSELVREPQAMFVLFSLFICKTDMLPDFIDRGKNISFLEKKNLAKKTINEKKHLHYNPAQLTDFGCKFCSQNIEQLKFFCENLVLSSKKEFDSEFANRKRQFYSNWETSYYKYEIFQIFELPEINKELNRQKVIFKIKRFKLISYQEPFWIFEFHCSVKCKRCKKEFEFNCLIKYSENEYRPLNFNKICPNCGLVFHCDAFFSRFYMDSYPI